jgi:uncharacterized membrane protein YkoI
LKEKQMKKFALLAGFTTIMLVGAPFALANVSGQEQDKEAKEQARLASQAKITKEQAQERALKRFPGTVESGELEKEHGKLVYSFDIRNAKGTITEVQVSAITGRIVRIEHESKKQEADEKKKEKH